MRQRQHNAVIYHQHESRLWRILVF